MTLECEVDSEGRKGGYNDTLPDHSNCYKKALMFYHLKTRHYVSSNIVDTSTSPREKGLITKEYIVTDMHLNSFKMGFIL